MRSLRRQINWYQRTQWAMLIASAGGLLAFYAMAYRPASARLGALRAQIESRRREVEQNQVRARNLPTLALATEQLKNKVQLYDRQFPRRPELGEFIRDITQISQQLSLQELRLQPLAPKRSEGCYEQPIQMSFQGDFLNIASFLRQLEEMQRLTRVRRLIMKCRPNKPGAVEVSDMVTSVYYSEG